MENREQQILSEITQMIASMRTQLDMLEDKVAKLISHSDSDMSDSDMTDETPIDLDLDDFIEYPSVMEGDLPEEPSAAAVMEGDLPEEPSAAAVMEGDLPEEPSVAAVMEGDLPEVPRQVIIDAMVRKEEWRTAIPGSPLKDIRGAISLHDRIIFINSLFDEDPILFQEVLTKVNSMSSLDEVVEYLREVRPEWDMESDEVYRFMMAVRRRIQ